jgi:asparagine synthase (glutamine-hydrolysing)
LCGIVGLIDLSRQRDEAGLRASVVSMAERLRHRGPDDAAHWVDARHGIALGFRRLAIQDLSINGRQPMTSNSGRYVVVFNGEIYNAPLLKRGLLAGGATFRGHSDTEVAVALIERQGFGAAIAEFSGMFAMACWDTRDRVLHLARDPMGKKPLYYGMVGGTFAFASEPKAFYALAGVAPEIDRDALATFFRFGYIPAPQTIYSGIAKLQAGECATVCGERVETRRYWSLHDCAAAARRDAVRLSDREATDQLETLLGDAVERRLVADVPLGAFLSGGIDSSVVASLMKARSSGAVQTFSIGFPEAAYDESAHAAAVAAHLGLDHHALQVTPSALLNAIPSMADIFDEPFADPSQVPTTILSQLTRQHLTVALSGDGGDELFRGYGRYATIAQIMAGHRRLPEVARPTIAWLLRNMPDRVWRAADGILPQRFGRSPLAARARRLADMITSTSPELIYRDLVGQWSEPGQLVLGAHEPVSDVWLGSLRSHAPDIPALCQLIDLSTYLPDDILQKVDRASMSVGLEVRSPILDLDIVRFALRLPADQLERGGASKWLLRQVLYRHLPRSLVDRPKMGFGFPLAEWLRGPLAPWADHLVHSLSQSGLIDTGQIQERWRAHRAGEADWSYRLWCAFMFEAWRLNLPKTGTTQADIRH